jgi:cysteine desulfurase
VALIAGFGAAAAVAARREREDAAQAERKAALFLDELSRRQVRWRRTTGMAQTVPGSLSLQLIGCDANEVATRLQSKVYLSTGSACSSGQISTSHVFSAMGIGPESSSSIIRVMLGRYLNDVEVIRAAELLSLVAISH